MSQSVVPENSPPRCICICVDDFGLHAGVNEAAIRLADLGRVHAIGCMVGGPAWEHGLAPMRTLLGAHAAPPDIGLHLDLTQYPLPPFPPQRLGALIMASALRWLDGRTIRQQIDAQLSAFEDGLGRPPDYVDGHQHVHQFPVVREALFDALADRYSGHLPWIRSTQAANQADDFKAWVIAHLGSATLVSMAAQCGLRHNKRLLGVYNFQGGATRYSALLQAWCQQAAHGDLLMCHPAVNAPDSDALATARQAEFEVLAGVRLQEALQQAGGLRLGAMSRILALPDPVVLSR